MAVDFMKSGFAGWQLPFLPDGKTTLLNSADSVSRALGRLISGDAALCHQGTTGRVAHDHGVANMYLLACSGSSGTLHHRASDARLLPSRIVSPVYDL